VARNTLISISKKNDSAFNTYILKTQAASKLINKLKWDLESAAKEIYETVF
jgi:hypothetical protein